MIKLEHLSLAYGEHEILNDINVDISEPGIYLLSGESGSGKTSLLNILSLMESSYRGNFYFDGQDVSIMSNTDKSLARFNKITYLFQIPKLIENESIKVNLEIALGRKINPKEEKEYLERIHLTSINKKVSSLSGGEKQRVNILMGILRNTPLILGDEITSGLDTINKKIIMKILKQESKKKIIILVSHDVDFIKEYAKEVRLIENKTFKPLKRIRKGLEINKAKENNKLPFSYAFRHAFHTISNKRIRTIISIFSSTIALTFLGICLILTSSLKDSVMSSLGSIIDGSQIIMEKKEKTYLVDESISVSKSDALKIYNRYNKDISYLGVNYLNDLDTFFEDENYFAYQIGDSLINISNLTVDNISSFHPLLVDEIDLVYGKNEALQEDEIILSFTHGEIGRICNQLNINYTDDSSLETYLLSHPLKTYMYLSNESWEYNLETSFNIVGYVIDDQRMIYHTDGLWNEYVVEEVMQMESSLKLDASDYYPWTVKKEYYLGVLQSEINDTLTSLLEDSTLNDYIFKCFKKGLDFGVSMEYAHNNYLKINECNNLIFSHDFLSSYIPCSSYGYNVVSNVLIAGFSKPTYISNDYELLEEFINMNSYSENDLGSYQGSVLSYTNKNIKSLSLLDATKDTYCHLNTYNKSTLGFNEIVISSYLANELGIDENLENNNLFIMLLKDVEYANGRYRNNFEIVNVKVKEIIESQKRGIYVSYLWPITFFMTNFNEDNYGIEKIILNYEGNNIVDDLSFLNDKYPGYNFTNPYLEYARSIDNVGYYLTLGLTIFSSFCLISTLLMLIVSSSLFVSETRKEIGIYSLYGYEETSIKRLYKIFAFIISFYALFVSLFSLLAIYFVLQNGEYLLSFNNINVLWTPILTMSLTSIFIGFISSRVSTRTIFKQSNLIRLQEK